MNSRFQNRTEAGQRLATKLAAYTNFPNLLVLGLPRGGVPVAYEIANALHAPLDVWLVRKLGVPGQEELAMGAIALGGVMILNQEIIQALDIPQDAIQRVAEAEQQELERRDRAYRGDRPLPQVQDHTVILVDDGIATSSTLRAAIAALQRQNPQRIVVAAPVAPPSVCESLRNVVDEVICLSMPEPLQSIGLWYQDFSQTTDEEVRELLKQSAISLAAIGER
ncbi:phosphoribosyltransferase [Egbenema bharatensis]|uniref:phosphoribosyltransferase n=1 Tax=Egbenema bharatensis TaxID=3463334 RepID=UPI003A86A95D